MQATENPAVTKNLYLGRLMSPNEVAGATLENRSIPSAVKLSWALCGDTSKECWELIQNKQEQVAYRISGFTSTWQSAFAIFTVQVRDHQTRFLLPLGLEKTNQFIESGGHNGIVVSLGRNGADAAVLREFKIRPDELEPLLAMSNRCVAWGGARSFEELQLVCIEALKLNTIPSALPGFQVSHAHLNVIAPDLLEFYGEDTYAGA
jgi:hypothetical protein